MPACEAPTCDKALLQHVDELRARAYDELEGSRRREMGQFLTPPAVAHLMASMLTPTDYASILDAGAGVGTLSAAYVAQACSWEHQPRVIAVTAYEVEPLLIDYLHAALEQCSALCKDRGIRFEYEVIPEDFIGSAVNSLKTNALPLGAASGRFTTAILNPPYKKIPSRSRWYRLLRQAGMAASNLYAAFIWLAAELVEPGGELVAITPRSFCNGPYFRSFRRALLDDMLLRRIHVFETRERVFGDDEVLQENIIVQGVKRPARREQVTVSSSAAADGEQVTAWQVNYDEVVPPDNADAFIYVVLDEVSRNIGKQMRGLEASLDDLAISVSTGRVVDFRVANLLRDQPDGELIPLIYPAHLRLGLVEWPSSRVRKPSILAPEPSADCLVVPADTYVLVKRFSAKEDARRVIAAVYDPGSVPARRVGFENHLNYFHRNGRGLPSDLARGLVAFLNSTVVDRYLRQFNGHTQVNAADLRNIRYPSERRLRALGSRVGSHLPDQDHLDRIIQDELGIYCGPEGGNRHTGQE